MPETDKPDPLELWKKGVWWQNAALRFATPEVRQRYTELENKLRDKPVFMYRLCKTMKVPEEAMKDKDFESIDLAEADERDNLRRRMEEDLIRWMRSGKLVAYGYADPRRPDDKPHEVPLDVWRFHPSDDGRLAGNGLKFHALRVLAPSWIPSATNTAASAPEPPPAPKPGRPSKGELILEAFESLYPAGMFARISQRQGYALIQKWVKENRPEDYEDGAGLQKNAIRNALGERLKDACAARNVPKQ